MDTELTYSENGLVNLSLFYKNTINIYVEDVDSEHIYENIFKRLLGEKYSIEKIYTLGGKLKVLEHFIEIGDHDKEGVPNIFLVDGDFDKYLEFEEIKRSDCFDKLNSGNDVLKNFLQGKIVVDESVLYLKTYNIENYYIDENVIISIVQGIKKNRFDDAKEILQFEIWKNRIVSESKELFLLYCFIQKYLYKYGYKFNGELSRLAIENVNSSPLKFIDIKTGFKGSNDRIGELKQEIIEGLAIENPDINLDEEIGIIEEAYEKINGKDYYNFICGKFLLTSLFNYLHGICGKLDFKDKKWQLVQGFDVNSLSYIKDKIEKLYSDS